MKKITIVGVGMGCGSVTAEGMHAIAQAEMLLGAPRLLELFASPEQATCPAYLPDAVQKTVCETDISRFSVLVSGDTGFFSAAEKLLEAFAGAEVTLIPGISSLNYFFSRLKRPWQEAALVSCHGRQANLVDTVRRNRLTFALTGGNVRSLARELDAAGFGKLDAYTGENLGSGKERIRAMSAAELSQAEIEPLTVLLVENPAFDARVRTGIADESFFRGSVPMTKAEVRAVVASKLCVSPGDICCDIGAGTGSVTIETALAAYNGHVYAVDPNPEAIGLVQKNARAFHIGNITSITAQAPEALDKLPVCNKAFIGGSNGRMHDIVSALIRNNPQMRIVATAVSIETANLALAALNEHGIKASAVQIGVSRTRAVGGVHMLIAQNPVFVISGGRADA
jgi:precorrin-6Y C5,15-methyltransferase (decarboxylating)